MATLKCCLVARSQCIPVLFDNVDYELVGVWHFSIAPAVASAVGNHIFIIRRTS